MSVHQVHVFISHSWWYSHHYDTLALWIFGRNWRFGQAAVDFRDYSVPSWEPILSASSDRALRAAIYRRISRCHVVVVPTGMYASHSKWIGKELSGAAYFGKPVLAVDPRGARRSSSVVLNRADLWVGWSSRSVVRGVWELYYR